MVQIRVDEERITDEGEVPALSPATRAQLVRQAVDSETLEFVGLSVLVAAIGNGSIAPGQLDVEALLDLIDGDTGGDVNFTRQGSGATSTLRGTLRDLVVGTAKIAANAVTEAKLSAAARGRLLPSGSPVTAFWSGTQAQYDAIPTKSATTLYLVDE